MAFHRVDGNPPFVIDRMPPPFIERAPGHYSLVADRDDATKAMEFPTQDAAVEFLREQGDDIEGYDWRVVPFEDLEPIER